jgi:hypothetical protein
LLSFFLSFFRFFFPFLCPADEESDPPAYRLLREIEKNEREIEERRLVRVSAVALMEEDNLDSLNRQLDGEIMCGVCPFVVVSPLLL